MADVGWATLGIIPSFDGFERKLNSGVGGPMTSVGGDAGSKFGDAAGTSASSRFKSHIKSAAKIAAVGLAAAGAVAFKFGTDAVGEAREAQKVGALTASTIKATGGAAKVTAKHVGDLSEKISEQAGIDDEIIQRGANMLLTFKNVRNEAGKGGKVFDRTTRAVADMAAGMAGGAGGDLDLKSSAILMGKALNDPVAGLSALTRVGVTFSDEQKAINTALVEGGDVAALNAMGYKVTAAEFKDSMEKRKATAEETVRFFTGPLKDSEKKYFDHLAEGGHTLEAQQNILKEVNSQFKGAAAAQSTEAEKMQVAWGNLKEEVGTELLPVLDDLAIFLREKGIPKAKEFIAWFKSEGVPGIKAFADEVRPVVGFVKDLGGYLKDLPTEVKIGGLAAVAGIIGGAKLRGGGGGILGSAGSALGAMKPIPVVVTNPGFAAAGAGNAAAGATAAGAAGSKKTAAAAGAGAAARRGSRMTFTRGALAVAVTYFAADAITQLLKWREKTPKEERRENRFERRQGIDDENTTISEKAFADVAKMLDVNLGSGLFGLMENDVGLSKALLKQDPTRLINLQKMLRHEYGLSFKALEDQGKVIDGTAGALEGMMRPAREVNAEFKTLPKGLRTEIKLLGPELAKRQVRELADEYDLAGKPRATLFKVLGVENNKRTMKTYTEVLGGAAEPVKTPVSLIGVSKARREIDGLGDALANLATQATTGLDAAADIALGRSDHQRRGDRDRRRRRNLGGFGP